jgi:single-stranded-DNA-specific exonuclease
MQLRERPRGSTEGYPASLHPVLQELYARRGVPAHELTLDLNTLLPPQGLLGIDAAVAVLESAIQRQQRIVVAADYDADGATACTLAVLGLQALGAVPVGHVVPDRFRMGYGLSPALVDLACEQGAEVLLTVDNGIASLDGVTHAKARGLKVIVTDHHLPGETLPAADALVNPNQPGCGFASKCIAGVGVMFYVLLALRARLRARGAFVHASEPNLADWLDLVALGTVADVVRLDHNNRVLVEQGLRRIRAGRARPGLLALLEAAGRTPASINATDLGFVLGPRLNAAGRLDDMGIGIQCLLAPSLAVARPLAATLDRLNRERRALTGQMSAEALDVVADPATVGLCVFDAGWHEGVVGLIAARLKEAWHRPTIACAPAQESGVIKGSARSIPGLHIRDAIAAVDAAHPGLLLRFGGHAMAAGLTLRRDDFARFAGAFDVACRQLIAPGALDPVIETDGMLPAEFGALETVHLLEQAGPWGQGFPPPLFVVEMQVGMARAMGSEQQHMRYQLLDDDGRKLEAVHFGGAEQALAAGRRARLLVVPEVNHFNGQTRLQHIEAI